MYRTVGLFTLSLLVTNPITTNAQSEDGLRIVPALGWITPLNDLGALTRAESTTHLRVASSPTAGLGLEWDPTRLPIGLRAHLAYAPSAELTGRVLSGERFCGDSCTKFIYDTKAVGEGSVLLLMGDAIFRAPRVGPLHPFAATGVGVKRYAFEESPSSSADSVPGDALGQTSAHLTLHLAAGIDFDLGPWRVSTEVGDYVSRYSVGGNSSVDRGRTRRQHDVAATVGLRFGLPW